MLFAKIQISRENFPNFPPSFEAAFGAFEESERDVQDCLGPKPLRDPWQQKLAASPTLKGSPTLKDVLPLKITFGDSDVVFGQCF